MAQGYRAISGVKDLSTPELSIIPEISELTWLLTCQTAKGLMNRAHAYKAAVQENIESASPQKKGFYILHVNTILFLILLQEA